MQTSPDVERKEEFRRYLEKSKITDAVTKTLVDLYDMETRPKDGMAWFLDAIKKNAETLGDGSG